MILPSPLVDVYGTNGGQGLAADYAGSSATSFVICPAFDRYAILSGVKSGTKVEARKSPRAKLGGAVAVTVRRQGSKRLEARLHEISVTGGILFLDEQFEAGCKVMLVFDTPVGLVKETAEMLPPHWSTKGCLQPFRFVDPGERSQRRLRRTLHHLLEEKS
jgi:hypothetical protein